MRKVIFEGDTLSVIRELPSIAKQRAGYEIDRVQQDKDPENGKPFPSIGKGVREIRIQVGRQFRVSISQSLVTACIFFMSSRKSHKKLGVQILI